MCRDLQTDLFFPLQDSCARVLLFRGGDKELKNYNSQTPFQVTGSSSPRDTPGPRARPWCRGRGLCLERDPISDCLSTPASF